MELDQIPFIEFHFLKFDMSTKIIGQSVPMIKPPHLNYEFNQPYVDQ